MNRDIFIAGVDEVGRGPLAGPVIAAAVILDSGRQIQGLGDSKQIAPARREELAVLIKREALCYALGRAEVEEIDDINILQASLLAMQRAVEALPRMPDLVQVDGIHAPKLNCETKTIIKGDVTVPAISAASILAKVARDAEMCALDQQYPGYQFSRHKGYPTKVHLLALERLGPSPIHRRSFGPVRKLITDNN